MASCDWHYVSRIMSVVRLNTKLSYTPPVDGLSVNSLTLEHYIVYIYLRHSVSYIYLCVCMVCVVDIHVSVCIRLYEFMYTFHCTYVGGVLCTLLTFKSSSILIYIFWMIDLQLYRSRIGCFYNPGGSSSRIGQSIRTNIKQYHNNSGPITGSTFLLLKFVCLVLYIYI